MTQATMRDPIYEVFAEHRKVIAQRDELAGALQALVAYTLSNGRVGCSSAPAVAAARAALAKVTP